MERRSVLASARRDIEQLWREDCSAPWICSNRLSPCTVSMRTVWGRPERPQQALLGSPQLTDSRRTLAARFSRSQMRP